MTHNKLRAFWHKVSYNGLAKDEQHPDARYIVFTNQLVTVMFIAVLLLDIAFFATGLYRIAFQLVAMLVSFGVIIWMTRLRHFNAARMFGLAVQNLNLFQLSLTIGSEARVIDFFFMMALLPLVLYNVKQKAAVVINSFIPVLFYGLYHFAEGSFTAYNVSYEQQMLVYYLTIPVKFTLVLVVVYILVRNHEISSAIERKRTLELERVNDSLRQFAYVTSHDLKTPLRNIATYLQMLKRSKQLDEVGNELIDHAVCSVKNMNQLIADILQYTTIDLKNKTVDKVDLEEVITSIQCDTGAIIKERNAAIVVQGSLPPVYVNRTQVKHVFANLVSNALKYNQSEQPRVEIKSGKVNGYTEFRVKDNGIGIDPAYKDRIFEIFKRLHTQEEYEGTGIGLAICKKIVESYGGQITVESRLGQGAEFIFTLPTENHHQELV